MKVLLFVVFCATSVWDHLVQADAPLCDPSSCAIENNCKCSSIVNPIQDLDDPSPQFIGLTVSESIVNNIYDSYWGPLFFDRLNPDGMPIGATFFVNHENTNYTLVQDLWLRGYDIGVHSITKNNSQEYWRTDASLDDLVNEFSGQRQIINTFANIPIEEIIGVRTPQLQLHGDVSIDAYVQSELTYDNSWVTSVDAPIFPYTLDYLSTQPCLASSECPTDSHAGFWIVPITNINGNGQECNSLATCGVSGSADDIANWLLGEVDRVRTSGTRSPIVVRLDSYWFPQSPNSFEGFSSFLDQVTQISDVFIVNLADILDWVKNPVPASQYSTPDHTDRDASCRRNNCHYDTPNGTEYMGSCVPCPPNYPWIGNPSGQ